MDMTPASEFTLITQHGEERKTRRQRFSDYDTAVAHARANTPDSDPSMVPNVDTKHSDHPNYEKGFFWHGNKYAALINGAAAVSSALSSSRPHDPCPTCHGRGEMPHVHDRYCRALDCIDPCPNPNCSARVQ
jgi:hypothetical protein